MSGHGGARKGSGRPIKWTREEINRVGIACDEREAEELAALSKAERDARQWTENGINEVWKKALSIPVAERKQWLESEEGDAHFFDYDIELRYLHNTPDDAEPPSFSIYAKKLPKGAKERIIAELAPKLGRSEREVAALWQKYREFVAELREPSIDPES